MIRTILADDHRLFSEGLEKLLSESGHFEILNKFHNGNALLENIDQMDPDLLILDIEIPGVNGLDALHRIRAKNSRVKIVMLSMHEELIYSREAFSEGANAYLTKSIESALLMDCLLKILDGEKMFPEVNSARTSQGILSKQEMKILRLIAIGKTSDQIADELIISNLTVKAHRRNMMRKLLVENSAGLVSAAFKKGIL